MDIICLVPFRDYVNYKKLISGYLSGLDESVLQKGDTNGFQMVKNATVKSKMTHSSKVTQVTALHFPITTRLKLAMWCRV